MAVSLSDLGEKAREQAMIKIAIEESRRRRNVPLSHRTLRGGSSAQGAAERETDRNKLHAKKVKGCLKDGTPHTFDSVREFDRYQELALMEKAGEIANLRTQVRYELIPAIRKRDGTLERATGYIADFVYEKDGETVVEDAKGYRNPKSAVYRVFALKRKMMLWKYGIEVKET